MSQSDGRPTAVFMGSPDFAVPTLERLHGLADIAAVYTQPDRPAGRGRHLAAPAVKRRALELGLAVRQPARLRGQAQELAYLAAVAPRVLVVAAYGLLLPEAVLAIPERGALNVHASLLPRWRGAAPIARAIAAGDARTGVSIMLMDAGLDTGPVLSRRELPLGPGVTAAAVTRALAELGADLLADTLPIWLAGEVHPEPQDDALATYAPRLTKGEGLLDWRRPSAALERHVRAMDPWPGAFTLWGGRRLKVLAARVGGPPMVAQVGEVVPSPDGPAVRCGEGSLVIDRLQLEGRAAQGAAEFVVGHPDLIGSILGDDGPARG